jgi:nucleoside-diphosphate-sugar epimerase
LASPHERPILITGANGFLGCEIVRQAMAAHLSVRATDKDAESLTHDVDYRRADILELSSLDFLFYDVTQVIHAAGLAHIFNRTKKVKAPFKAVNEQGTANVCLVAAKAGVGHFILISSVSVYGPSTQGLYDENTPCLPDGPYAESKYQAEQRAIEIAQKSGMALTILRLATLYGENDPGNVSRLMRSIDRRHFIWIGNGTNLKSLLYKGDAAHACIITMLHPTTGIKIYNVSARPSTMKEVIEGLAKALGRHIPGLHIPPSMLTSSVKVISKIASNRGLFGNLHDTLEKWLADDAYDARQFQNEFGFQTEVGLIEGLRREVEWYRGNTNSAST